MLSAPADARAADWVVASVRDFDYTVGSVVPTAFEAHARVFHPAERREGDKAVQVRWAEVASANGREMHPAAEWGSLTGAWQMRGQPGLWDGEPRTGELPATVATAMAAVLAEHTTSPNHCWFALYAGREVLSTALLFHQDLPEHEREQYRKASEARRAAWDRLARSEAPRFELPDRPMRLLQGCLAALDELYVADDPPNLWWPDDHAWCVGSEIDLMTTYVGGTRRCIEALLGDDRLEAFPVSVDQGVTWEADTINPLPGRP
jgi:hypothetical protein